MQKIAFLAPANSVHTRKWLNGLVSNGRQITLYSQHEAIDGFNPLIRIVRLPVHSSLGYFCNAPFMRSMLRREGVDLLHVFYASGYGTLGRLVGFHPLVLSVWGSDVYLFPKQSYYKRRVLEKNLKAADFILSTSMDMANETSKYTYKPIQITPFGVDIDLFSPRQPTPREKSSIVLGVAKNLEPVYGFDILLKALAILKGRTKPRFCLRIAGEGAEKRHLEELAIQLGISSDIDFQGKIAQSEMPAFYGSLDIFINPSRSESFGVSILEASACGLPVVASDVGGIPEVVMNGETGLLVPSEDSESLAAAILRLSTDAELRASMGSAGRSFVRKKYSIELALLRMNEIYGGIPSGHREDTH
jgi:L-malate glycosyltransferase